MTTATESELHAIAAIIESARALVLAADADADNGDEVCARVTEHLDRIDDLKEACVEAVRAETPAERAARVMAVAPGREFVAEVQRMLTADSAGSPPIEYSPEEANALYRVVLAARDREIELLRGAIRVLGDSCDVARGEPNGTCSGRQFAAIDKELGR